MIVSKKNFNSVIKRAEFCAGFSQEAGKIFSQLLKLEDKILSGKGKLVLDEFETHIISLRPTKFFKSKPKNNPEFSKLSEKNEKTMNDLRDLFSAIKFEEIPLKKKSSSMAGARQIFEEYKKIYSHSAPHINDAIYGVAKYNALTKQARKNPISDRTRKLRAEGLLKPDEWIGGNEWHLVKPRRDKYAEAEKAGQIRMELNPKKKIKRKRVKKPKKA